MSDLDGNLHGVITLAMMATFIGIWIWAWRKRHKKVFDRMSQLPMEDDLAGATKDDENKRNSL